MRRLFGALVAAVMLTVGVISASSLGSFSDIAFSAFAEQRTPCTQDDVTLLDGTLDLMTGTILPTSELTAVELTNVSGDCVGTVPVVVVYGIDLTEPLVGEQRLFTVDQLAPLVTTGDVALPLTEPIPLGDGLSTVFYTLTEVRVTYCPGGNTCT